LTSVTDTHRCNCLQIRVSGQCFSCNVSSCLSPFNCDVRSNSPRVWMLLGEVFESSFDSSYRLSNIFINSFLSIVSHLLNYRFIFLFSLFPTRFVWFIKVISIRVRTFPVIFLTLFFHKPIFVLEFLLLLVVHPILH